MADYTFFNNPMSRAMIAHWALMEVGADFKSVTVEWDSKPQALLDANPMGKIPTIIHHAKSGDHVVSECAAICHYLAEAEQSQLLPADAEKADYFRWMFFAAGPLEAAITAKTMGWEVPDGRKATAGFGSYELVIDTLDWWLKDKQFVCGDRFTMADVYVGSQVAWGIQFGTLTQRQSFGDYHARLSTREAYKSTIGAASI